MSTFNQEGQTVGTQVNRDYYWKDRYLSCHKDFRLLRIENDKLRLAIQELTKALAEALGMPKDGG